MMPTSRDPLNRGDAGSPTARPPSAPIVPPADDLEARLDGLIRAINARRAGDLGAYLAAVRDLRGLGMFEGEVVPGEATC